MIETVVDLAGCAEQPSIGRGRRQGPRPRRLLARSLEVPAGFVVTTDAYRAFVAEHGLDGRIARILDGAVGVAGERDAALAIEAMFASVALESDQVDAAYALLRGGGDADLGRRRALERDRRGRRRCVLRGPAGKPPLDPRRGRGAPPHRGLLGSLFSAPAISYRRRVGAREDDAAMAVVVQAMVAAQAAGVMFTIDPVTGDPSQITIEGTVGLHCRSSAVRSRPTATASTR